MAKGDGLALFEQRLTEGTRPADGFAFDPVTILAIISAVLPLIQNCFKPKPAALRRRLFNRSRVASALREKNPNMTWRQSMAEADNLFDLADNSTDAELEMLIEDCCG